MRVFSDFHHAGLWNSFLLIWEKRLGYELYRPIGMEWYPEYWKLNDIEATAQQFLGPGSVPSDGTSPLNNKLDHTITFEDFKKTKFDILIASIPQHIEPFKRLISMYQPNAKLIFQIGNAWTIDTNQVKNVMASALLGNLPPPPGTNLLMYHQEIPLDIFSPLWNREFNGPNKNIFSFVNCFNTAEIFAQDWNLFLEIEREMPAWTFKAFGGQCRDQWCNGDREVAGKMAECRFGFHLKYGGDGFGHVIHDFFAMGKPTIIKTQYYEGKMAGRLMVDGETCIAVDGLSVPEIINKINYFDNGDRYATMSLKAYTKFLEEVDYDKEELAIRDFLSHLL